jgi:hypothetical protein
MSALAQLPVPHHADMAHQITRPSRVCQYWPAVVLPSESEIPKFVIRKNLRGQPVGEPLLCVDAT